MLYAEAGADVPGRRLGVPGAVGEMAGAEGGAEGATGRDGYAGSMQHGRGVGSAGCLGAAKNSVGVSSVSHAYGENCQLIFAKSRAGDKDSL